MKTIPTSLVIRVQALGGMFLGPDSFGGAAITLSNRNTGKQLATGLTDAGDSGTRSLSYQSGSSPSVSTSLILPAQALALASNSSSP